MKERPILFSTPMVQAILAGNKTMTRRVIKPQPTLVSGDALGQPYIYFNGNPNPVKCPCGVPGDRLWVRETWRCIDYYGETATIYFPSTNEQFLLSGITKTEVNLLIGSIGKTMPSIFMPRWASRITLEITNIRVERVQQITHEDAISEGARFMPAADLRVERLTVPQIVFAGYWDSIHAKRGYGWDVNPWVWVIEFKIAQS
jgi:hypothetical protein